ncbi:MAG TPA: hypothetical protein VIL99_08490 [Ignavibacteria bacterium]
MKLSKYISALLDILIVSCLLVFFSSYGFNDSRNQGWYVQTFPYLDSCNITSFAFLDSLKGFAVTNQNPHVHSYILKTTNGGDNWAIINSTYPNFNKIQFADKNTGYASAYTNYLWKTTDGGDTWFTLTYGGLFYPQDMAVINKDTVLFVMDAGLGGGVFRTTDGGNTFARIWGNSGTGMPYSIYMYNKYLGFQLYSGPTSYDMRRTSDGGFTWTNITGEQYVCIQMLDSLTGWKGYAGIKKTTDGGLTWISQQVPIFTYNSIRSISILNKDTVWLSVHIFMVEVIYLMLPF